MARSKKTKLLKKGATLLAVAGVLLTTPVMLAGCVGEKGEVGPQGPAGATWYSGTQYSQEEGKIGDFFYDTDDCTIYQKTNAGWTLILSIKGDTGVAKEVEIQASQDYIQWRYKGDTAWQNLVSLNALKGAKGEDGEDAVAPTVTIENGVWVINGNATEYTAVATDGVNGKTPYILNGYWYIDGTNLNIKAEGKDGEAGNNGKSAYEIAYALDNTIGTEEQWIASLKAKDGKDGREVLLNVSATHIQWKYSGEEAWEDLIAIESLKGLKGDPGSDGKSAYQIAKDEGFDGTEAEWLASLKGEKGDPGKDGAQGETGNGITNVEIVYEYDDNGQLWAVFTITYSLGEPQIIRSAVPKKLVSINCITLENNHTSFDKITKVESENDIPTLYLSVMFDDYTDGRILLTEDMFTVNESYGYCVPDFTKLGLYNYEIKYMGKTLQGYIEVVDLASYSAYTVESVHLHNATVPTGYKKSDLLVNINYSISRPEIEPDYKEYVWVNAPLSAVADSYYSYDSNQTLTDIDLSVANSYVITLKSEFAFKYNPENEEFEKLYLAVYDSTCSIANISFDDIVLTLGDADFEDALKAQAFNGYSYIPNEFGDQNFSGTVADLTYDLSKFDINRVGTQYIPFTYQLKGETGKYSDLIRVSVFADLSTAQQLGTYTPDVSDPDMMMFMMAHGDTVILYDNGVAEIVNGGYTVQTTYDMSLIESNVLKFYDSNMDTYAYYSIDTSTNSIKFYSVEGEIIPTDYSGEIVMMDMPFDVTISVYGTEGTCKTKVSLYNPEAGMLVAYSFVDCTWVDNDTLAFAGRTFNVLTGNTLVEVTE